MLSVETICNLTGDDCFDHSKYGTYDMYSHFQIQSSEESEMEVQITCDNLKLGYGAGVLVDGLSFTVEKGDYLCIVGENGAGKSTLLRTLLGLQKPLAGKITFGGGL